ncbi:SCO family protein [Paenibacillus sp. FJAT-26967]|uniref:SCO family protein n=1 Tax=Paenibacillus sp. FJAT-26967 TaxID=1729690 RepID=UPI0008389B7C|nr:SCO family protein [Paenibacillus sp. FJAT-26967]
MADGFWSKNWFKVSISVVLIAVIASFAFKLSTQDQGRDYLDKDKSMGPSPSYQLTDAEGNQAASADYDGKVKLVYFFFASCPDVCPITTNFLSKVQDEMKKEKVFENKANIVSISFDPARDTPDALKEYALRNRADFTGWKFLTGTDEKEMAALAKKFQVGVTKDKNGNFTHNNVILLLDKKGEIRTYYNANNPDLDQTEIVKDMKVLIKER